VEETFLRPTDPGDGTLLDNLFRCAEKNPAEEPSQRLSLFSFSRASRLSRFLVVCAFLVDFGAMFRTEKTPQELFIAEPFPPPMPRLWCAESYEKPLRTPFFSVVPSSLLKQTALWRLPTFFRIDAENPNAHQAVFLLPLVDLETAFFIVCLSPPNCRNRACSPFCNAPLCKGFFFSPMIGNSVLRLLYLSDCLFSKGVFSRVPGQTLIVFPFRHLPPSCDILGDSGDFAILFFSVSGIPLLPYGSVKGGAHRLPFFSSIFLNRFVSFSSPCCTRRRPIPSRLAFSSRTIPLPRTSSSLS